MTSFEVLERNLTALFARAYVPVQARESFRAELEADFLARADAFARKRRGPVSQHSTRWRMVAAAALVFLCAGLGWWFAGRAAPVSTFEQILARGEAAVRFERAGAWSSRSAGQSAPAIEVASAFIELHTPRDASVQLSWPAKPDSAAWTVVADSHLSIELESATVVLEKGGLEGGFERGFGAFGAVSDKRWTLRTRAGELGLVHGEVRIGYELPADPSAWESAPREDCAWVAVRVDAGEALLPRRGVEFALIAGGEAFLSCGEALLRRETSDAAALDDRASVASSPEPAPVQPTASEPLLFEGSITRASDGAPLDEFRVVLLPVVQLPQVGEPVFEDFRGAQGRLAVSRALLDRVDSGAKLFRVEIQSAGLAPHRIERFVANEDGPTQLAIELGQGSTARGIVVDDRTGLAVAGAWVIAEHDTPLQVLAIDPREVEQPSVVVATHSRGDGGFEMPHLRAGQHLFRASAPGYGPSWSKPVALLDGALASDIEIRLQAAARVEGSVVDAAGEPQANVVLIGSTTNFTRPCMSFDFALSDAQGRFEFVDMPVGYTSVLKFAPASRSVVPFAPEMKFVTLESGKTTRVDFHAKQALQVLRGTVRDSAGRAVAGCSVMVAPSEHAGPPPEGKWLSCTTAADGTYELPDIEPGHYELCVSARTLVEIVYVGAFEIVPGASAVHDVVLSLGSIRGQVSDARTNEPLAFAVLLLVRRTERGETFAARAFTDARGEYELPYLTSDIYDLNVYESKGELSYAQREGLTLSHGEQMRDVNFALEPGASLALTVTSEDGVAIADARIECRDARGRVVDFSERSRTNERGEHRVAGMSTAVWRVAVEASGFERAELSVDLGAGGVHERTVKLKPR